jgi:acyl-CoA synthetase (AMP-forming)/AMP-acid ligase II
VPTVQEVRKKLEELRQQKERLTSNELIEHCRRSLASYKIPRRVEFLSEELPKSGSGKILKRVLRERFWADQTRVEAVFALILASVRKYSSGKNE